MLVTLNATLNRTELKNWEGEGDEKLKTLDEACGTGGAQSSAIEK